MTALFTIHPYNSNRAFVTVNRDVTEDDIVIERERNTDLIEGKVTSVPDWLDDHDQYDSFTVSVSVRLNDALWERLRDAIPASTKELSGSRGFGYGGHEDKPGLFAVDRKVELSVRGCRTDTSKRNKKKQTIHDLLFTLRQDGGRDRLIWEACELLTEALKKVAEHANKEADEILRDNFVFVKHLNADYIEKALDEDLRYKALHRAAEQEIAEVEAQLELLKGRRDAALLQKKDAIRRAVWKRAHSAYGEEINKRVEKLLRDESPALERSVLGGRAY